MPPGALSCINKYVQSKNIADKVVRIYNHAVGVKNFILKVKTHNFPLIKNTHLSQFIKKCFP
jgi:hypothetical protein